MFGSGVLFPPSHDRKPFLFKITVGTSDLCLRLSLVFRTELTISTTVVILPKVRDFPCVI